MSFLYRPRSGDRQREDGGLIRRCRRAACQRQIPFHAAERCVHESLNLFRRTMAYAELALYGAIAKQVRANSFVDVRFGAAKAIIDCFGSPTTNSLPDFRAGSAIPPAADPCPETRPRTHDRSGPANRPVLQGAQQIAAIQQQIGEIDHPGFRLARWYSSTTDHNYLEAQQPVRRPHLPEQSQRIEQFTPRRASGAVRFEIHPRENPGIAISSLSASLRPSTPAFFGPLKPLRDVAKYRLAVAKLALRPDAVHLPR